MVTSLHAQLAPADDELRGQVEHCCARVGPKGFHSTAIMTIEYAQTVLGNTF
jgi:hypothetical protein